ncbi:hypothetical protein P872_12155 [Rhodonellum psychrophilum GCM71 = DSM 17998]|uniref:Uncharacterized protein n=2 Tax=Rhodonellum TaxID=336827 RepID=U5BK42_9BACT|nr:MULTISPECIES: hypothetical protein [Rhodonellum]ERM80820.1 hypothetical protein P872_12155 [Rhodonellum psychrophilum GCM71 = DSM 17998]SDZ24081.1 hypothetical protein SAMN05444412_10873 [Rhodonellum ikkaensis]
MKGNRILMLQENLKEFKRQEKPTRDKSNVSESASFREIEEEIGRISNRIVDEDVFIVEILDFFFNRNISENQISDELREIAAECLFYAIKEINTNLIPFPPDEKPSVSWLTSEIVQNGYHELRKKNAFLGFKSQVGLKFKDDFETALLNSKISAAPKTMAQSMSSAKTALVVFMENTGALPFQWENSVGKLVQEGLEKIIDYVSEEFVKWLNKFKEAKGKKYQEVIILEDGKATYENLKVTLIDLSQKGYIIDVFTLAHGNASSFSGYQGISISDRDLQNIRNSYGSPLPLRVVYMMNCVGSGLNDDWLYVGAKAVAGSIRNNYIPEPMMSKFWQNWLRGDTFESAVKTAYNDSVKLITHTISNIKVIWPIPGVVIKAALEPHINRLLVDSEPKIEGNASLRIDSVSLVSGKSLSLTGRYSKAKYDTGEHVLAGLVSAFPVTPTYNIPIKGVDFTYAELIAMGDFYEDYDKMAKASASELVKLKALIDKSKRYYEGKLKGSPVGANPEDSDWQQATSGRYLKLAEDNFAHFAPSNSTYIASFSSAKPNHKSEWEKYHGQAISIMRKGMDSSAINDALVVNGFGDHFLTDAFAAGHLFNKDEISNYFKMLVLNSSGKINKQGEEMFGKIASKSFQGKLKDEFSKHETVDRLGGVWRPNINSADRFTKLLIGIMEQEPDIMGKTMVVKLIHDALNNYSGGISVTNNMGNKWQLRGDAKLDEKNLEAMRKAVVQSINNLSDALNDSSPVSMFFKKVWDYTPQPTAASVTIIKNLIRNYTNPARQEIVDGAVQLLQKNYQSLLDELIKRNILKKA